MEEQQRNELIIGSKAVLNSEEEYRAYPAINYSKLSSLATNPQYVNSVMKKTESMILGSIVDNLITQGKRGDEYVVAMYEKPTGQIGDFCDLKISGCSDEDAYIAAGFKRDKIETVLAKYEEGPSSYVRESIANKDKTLVSAELIMKAEKIVEDLKTNPITREFFNKPKEEHIEIRYQVAIVFNLPKEMGQGKALMDLIVINHRDKTIKIYDLKTTSSNTKEFKSSFMKYKYYLQASLYYYGLASITNYMVTGFEFIVASTTDIGNPLIWRATTSDINVGRFGINRPNSTDVVKGWEQLVKELSWHQTNDKWNLPYELAVNNVNNINMFEKWEK